MLSIRSIQKMISNLSKKAKINRMDVTPHRLRHSFATNYLRNNPECLAELSELLGHESLDTTAIYTKPSLDRMISTLEKTQFIEKEL